MDVTTLFKACVKTVRTTNKNLGIKDGYKSNILRTAPKDARLTKAKDILKQISSLQNFLNENKAAYLNVLNYLSTNKTMTAIDREEIDTNAEKIVSLCSSLIHDYREEIKKHKQSIQLEEHYENVVESLENYLKGVSKIYTAAKALRVKRVIETHKLSKLETIHPKSKPKETPDSPKASPETKKALEIPLVQQEINEPENQLSAEELQMFEAENELLYNELNSMSDEVKQMESKVVHIAELQELFTEKVLQQEKDIERISTVVAGSTDNMKDANEQIRQAIQRNAGLRVWVLFFLLVMSFSLLFLDWYND